MTAVLLTAHGGPEVLDVRDDVPVPGPGPGEVRVRVTAAGVNNTDVWTREGAYGRPDDPDAVAGWKGVPVAFPRVQGGDACGVVDAVGDDVDRGLVGRRVLVDPIRYGPGPDADTPAIDGVLGSEEDGAFAQFLVTTADRVHDVSASPLDDAGLACLPIAYGTATGMLERAGPVAERRVLVTGASGGVGLALVQLAAARGARVVAVTRGDHADAVRDAGADVVVPRDGGRDATTAVRDAVGEVDVVADVVGGAGFAERVDLLRDGGTLVTCGAVAGPVVELDLRVLYLRRRRLVGSTMHTATQFARLVEDANAGRVAPVVADAVPLAGIVAAQRRLVDGDVVGKLVLVPPPVRGSRSGP